VLAKALEELPSWHRALPLAPNPLVEGLDDWYNDFLAHPEDGPFWWRWNIGHRHAEVETPIVHMGGWFDIFLAGTIKNFVGMRAKARQATRDASASSSARGSGPWAWRERAGRGRPARSDPRLQRDPVPWFDHWLGPEWRPRRAASSSS
jgi:predicted acyl esterase